MGGLILVNIIVFLYRIITGLVGEHRSRHWPTTAGILTEARSNENSSYPLARVAYSYRVHDKNYSGVYKKGFWYRDSASQFAKGLVPQFSLVVRYRTEAPTESFLSRADQHPTNQVS